MTRHTRVRVCGAAIAGLFVAVLVQPIKGQTLHSVVEPRDRVFPTAGPGVTALKYPPCALRTCLAGDGPFILSLV